MTPEEIAEVVRRALRTRDTTAFRAARDAGLPDNAIRHLLDGRDSRISRLVEICDALGLEFYVGRSRVDAGNVSLLQPSRVPPSARGAHGTNTTNRSATDIHARVHRPRGSGGADDDWLESMVEPLRQEYRALDKPGRALMLIRLVAAFLDTETPTTHRAQSQG